MPVLCRAFRIGRGITPSPPPYLNGAPRDYLLCEIDCSDSSFTPGTLAEWLERPLPRQVSDLAQLNTEEQLMNEAVRSEVLSLARQVHDLTESAYQENSAMRGESGWNYKQRILLADMALHLLQTALKHGELSHEGLKRNLFSILTISDQLMPGHELKAVAEKLYFVPVGGLNASTK